MGWYSMVGVFGGVSGVSTVYGWVKGGWFGSGGLSVAYGNWVILGGMFGMGLWVNMRW